MNFQPYPWLILSFTAAFSLNGKNIAFDHPHLFALTNFAKYN